MNRPERASADLDAEIRQRGSMSLALPGWERCSTWDLQDDHLVACMWRNGHSGGPDICVDLPSTAKAIDLATLVHLQTGQPLDEVIWAMGVDVTGWPTVNAWGEFCGGDEDEDTGTTVTLREVYDKAELMELLNQASPPDPRN
jgi:hypothetical protein